MHYISYRVHLVRYKKFEQWVIRHKEDDFRHPASSWIGKQNSSTTQKTYATRLMGFLNWVDSTGFDLQANLSKGVIMTKVEIASLAKFVVKDSKKIAAKTFESSLITISSYLQWEAEQFSAKTLFTSPLRDVLKDELRRFKENISNEITRYARTNPPLLKKGKSKGLKLDEISRLELFLNPASIERECKDLWGEHARRNWLIVSFFYFYGIRQSELQQLKTTMGEDGTFGDGHIAIVPDETPEKDPRKKRPGFKTQSRLLPMDTVLWQQVSAYIQHERRRVSKNQKIQRLDYLFLTNRGPISDASVIKIVGEFLGQLVKANTTNPHCLRHTCANNFVRRLGNLFPSDMKPEQKQAHMHRLLSYWFGWSNGGGFRGQFDISPTATIYTEMIIREMVTEESLKHQKQVMTNLLSKEVLL
jgi:integrase